MNLLTNILAKIIYWLDWLYWFIIVIVVDITDKLRKFVKSLLFSLKLHFKCKHHYNKFVKFHNRYKYPKQ